MNPTTCQSCDSADRIALVGDRWLCVACAPPVPCCKCGAPAKAMGVERFTIGHASNNARYDLAQSMVSRCSAERPKHFTHGPGHMGPGARKPPQVYDALHVYVDGVLLTEGRVSG